MRKLAQSASATASIAASQRQNDPEQETLLADSVGFALLIVLDRLDPAERLAFVLHDMFAVSFDEIASILGRSPEAARQLASRARRRVQGAPAVPTASITEQRRVADAFLAALRAGDLEGLIAVLDPDVVVRIDEAAARPGAAREIRGARNWALRGHLKTGQRWSLQNRTTESGLGLGCFTPTPPVEASLFSCANSVDRI